MPYSSVWTRVTVIGNMTGHPCLTLRAGFTTLRTRRMPAFLNAEIKEADGSAHTVPYAVTVVAPLFQEEAALTLGRARRCCIDDLQSYQDCRLCRKHALGPK